MHAFSRGFNEVLFLLSAATLLASSAHAEARFPETRKYVGTDEIYLLESFGDWDTLCLKSDNGEDFCLANLAFNEPDQSLALKLAIMPSIYPIGEAKADVDIVPRAIVSVDAVSAADHYDDYSAFISKIDDQPFDGYWCNITDETCDRGPTLERDEVNQLLAGTTAELAIYQRLHATENSRPVATVELSLVDLRKAFDRAMEFNSEILDFKPDDIIETQSSGFTFDGTDRRISYVYDEDFDKENRSMRESVFGAKAGDCPSYVVLAYATPDATRAQRQLFCLNFDKETKQYLGFEEGEQTAYGICKKPKRSFCERVNSSKAAAMSIAGFGAGSVGTAVGSTSAAGITVVAHSSGAYILTGTSGYIAGTLGTIGTSALAVLTAPATITGAVVTVVAVGGAVYVCGE